MKRIKITEEQLKNLSNILTENRESKNLSKARKYIRSVNPNIDVQKIVDGIRTDIPNSRIADCKFILGIARLYLNNELNSQQIISRLNQTLKLIGSEAHVNEYDNNFNNESVETLIERFAINIQTDLENEKGELNLIRYTENTDYKIISIDSFEEANKYSEYTSWCVTHYDDMFNHYTHNGMGRFYFCLKDGFKNVLEKRGEGCPLDEYGLSMIAVSINEDGSCNTITCRWNHDNGGNDNIMTPKELSEVIGRNFYDTFKPYTDDELVAKGIITPKYAQMLLDDGKTCYDIFDEVFQCYENNFARVKLNGKWNFVNTDRKIISKQWFDYVCSFEHGFAKVTKTFVDAHGYEEEGYNFINEKGEILSDIWFYSTAFGFVNGFIDVMLKNGKLYKLNTKGQLCNRYGEPINLQNESIVNNLQVLSETTWNYHKSHGEHDGTPYYSDSKYVMDGRDTGSFGSGTYFSTFKEESPKTDEKYGDAHENQNPEFIKIDDRVYRVDIDLYKNLYRVYSTKQGDVLYTLLHNVNKLFNRINQFGKFHPKDAYYENADLYQKIIRNAEALNLKCPSYLKLTRMAQELGKDDSRKQSLSTVFMEYNGYNGVNVSNVPYFDNTLHGSVIYDLSKVEGSIKQELHNSLIFADGSYKTSVVPRGFMLSDDYELSALNKENYTWLRKVNDMPLNRAMRLLKNYVSSGGRIFDEYEMKCLGDDLQKRYLKLVYNTLSKSIGSTYNFSNLLPYIYKHKAYYWVNFEDEYDKISGLVSLLSYYENYEMDWGLSEEETNKGINEYFNKLMMYHNGDLSSFEKYMLEKNDYAEILNLSSDTIDESVELIKEDREGKNMAKARQVVKRYGYRNMQYTPQEIITIVRDLVPNSRLNDCQYLPYATHCYMESELVDPVMVKNLNDIIPIMAKKGYVPFVSESETQIDDSNTIIELMHKFMPDVSDYYESLKYDTNKSDYKENNHQYIIHYIPNFEEANKYENVLGEWCIVNDEDDWAYRVSNQGNTCYFCIRDDFERPYEDENNFDDNPFLFKSYALSAICVIVDNNGNPQSITTRLNSTHVDQQGHAITPKLLSQIIGKNFYDVFLPHVKDGE